MKLEEIIQNRILLEIGRKAIEDELIELRDCRMATIRNNGLVIAERNGERSNVIRLGPEDALRIGLRAIAEHLKEKNQC
jgi:hypothetical protein